MADNEDPTLGHWSGADLKSAQSDGMDIRDNPQNSMPPLAGLGQMPQPNGQDRLFSALQGFRSAVQGAQQGAGLGDPFTAALSGLAGAAAAPNPQMIAAQRAQMQMQMMGSLPVDQIAPNLVAAHPELKGMPLAVVERLAPVIERAQAFNDSHYNLDQAAQIASPDQASVSKTRAQLATMFPNGIVPKDFVHVAAMNNRMEQTFGQKAGVEDDKRLTALGDALDPSKARAGAFGVSKQVFDRAERLQSLASAYKDGNLDPRQMEELAIGLNSMLSGSNTGASEQVKSLVPNTIIGNAEKFKEWLTNNPQGTQQQAFVQRMLGSIEREKATASDQILRTQLQRTQRFADLEKKNPDQFYNVLQAQGIDPQTYQSWKKGGMKSLSAVQQPEAVASDGLIRKTLSGGKTGVWDSNGKFLRYE